MAMRILLIEDDELLGDGIQKGLSQFPGIRVDWLKDGNSALSALQSEHFDVILLDLNLPGKSGLEILNSYRQSGHDTPVIILTAKDAVQDRVKGLDTGADDYVVKPFDLNELLARIRALKRRSLNKPDLTLTYEKITLDPTAHSVTFNGEEINLPRREFTLLQKLMENVGQVLSREKLTQALYGWGEEIDSNTLEVHIHNLRKKLQLTTIRTIRGIGYMLEKEK